MIGCFRKTAHPMYRGGYQGWEEAIVADTLNVYDNTETRTPIVICIQGGGQTSLNAQGCGWSDGGVAYTLNTVDNNAVCYGISRSLLTGGMNGGVEYHLGKTSNQR